MNTLEVHYAAGDIEARILAGLRQAGLDPDQRLSPEALAPLDHFHTGGLQSSRDLLELAQVGAADRVLDIGAGLAGCARLMAHELGCRVDCIEMSGDYCDGARLLNRLTGLEALITLKQGSATDLPYADGSFDVAWMQNVGMNIADKQGLYREISRVLKPGGRFAFQEVAEGAAPVAHFPLPWASEPGDNWLLSPDSLVAILADHGLIVEQFDDVSDALFSTSSANSTPASQGELGLAVYVDNLGQKAGNARRCLDEGQLRYVRGLFRRK